MTTTKTHAPAVSFQCSTQTVNNMIKVDTFFCYNNFNLHALSFKYHLIFLNCTVLLYGTELYCTACCTVRNCTVLYTVQYVTVLYCTVYCTVRNCSVLYTARCCTALYTALLYSTCILLHLYYSVLLYSSLI